MNIFKWISKDMEGCGNGVGYPCDCWRHEKKPKAICDCSTKQLIDHGIYDRLSPLLIPHQDTCNIFKHEYETTKRKTP